MVQFTGKFSRVHSVKSTGVSVCVYLRRLSVHGHDRRGSCRDGPEMIAVRV